MSNITEEEILLSEEELDAFAQPANDVVQKLKESIQTKLGLDTTFRRPRRRPPDLGGFSDDDEEEIVRAVSELTDNQLTDLLAEYTQFANWLGTEVSEAEATRRLLEGNVERLEALIALKLQFQGYPQTKIPMRTKSHTLVVSLSQALDRERAFEEILRSRQKAYSKSAGVLSRVITIRTGVDEGGDGRRAKQPPPKRPKFAR
jgi:hypothetical protein